MQALLRGAGACRPRVGRRWAGTEVDAPLRGTVVVELASVLAGPSVGQFLAEMGARVIKVESPHTGGDVTRGWRAPGEAEDVEGRVSSYFSCCNWGKESIAVDLRHEEGRVVVHRLVARADIVLSSFKPGDAAKFGLAPGQLLQDNPRVIVAEITGYGLQERRAAYDAVIQAEVGFFHLNGHPDGPPTKLPVALMDVLAAHQLKEAILLRLLARERSGRGGHVTVSLARAGVASLANQALNWLHANFRPGRMGRCAARRRCQCYPHPHCCQRPPQHLPLRRRAADRGRRGGDPRRWCRLPVRVAVPRAGAGGLGAWPRPAVAAWGATLGPSAHGQRPHRAASGKRGGRVPAQRRPRAPAARAHGHAGGAGAAVDGGRARGRAPRRGRALRPRERRGAGL